MLAFTFISRKLMGENENKVHSIKFPYCTNRLVFLLGIFQEDLTSLMRKLLGMFRRQLVLFLRDLIQRLLPELKAMTWKFSLEISHKINQKIVQIWTSLKGIVKEHCVYSHQIFFDNFHFLKKSSNAMTRSWRHLFSFNQIFPAPSRLIRFFFVFSSRFPSLALLPSTSINDYDLTFVQCQRWLKAFSIASIGIHSFLCESEPRSTLWIYFLPFISWEKNGEKRNLANGKINEWREGPFLLNYGFKSTLKKLHFSLFTKIFVKMQNRFNLGIKLFILIKVKTNLRKRFCSISRK